LILLGLLAEAVAEGDEVFVLDGIHLDEDNVARDQIFD
jgi:hypothetical protein